MTIVAYYLALTGFIKPMHVKSLLRMPFAH
jgi:hypothetical protein